MCIFFKRLDDFPQSKIDRFSNFRKMRTNNSKCGNSSVGRARPCQGRGREFEPRFPLQTNGVLAKRLCTGLQIHVARFDSGTRLHYYIHLPFLFC